MAEAVSAGLATARRALAPRRRLMGGISSADAPSGVGVSAVPSAPPPRDLTSFAEKLPWEPQVYLALYERDEQQHARTAAAHGKPGLWVVPTYLPLEGMKPGRTSGVYLPTPPRLLEPKWWQLPTYPKDRIEIETTQIHLRNR